MLENFDQLVRDHLTSVTGFCFRILRSWSDSEDAASETMLCVYRKAATYTDRNIEGLLYTVARRKCLDVIRRRRCDALSQRVTSEDFDALDACYDDESSPLDRMIRDEDAALISQAVETLPDDQQATLLLSTEYSLPQIADASGCPLGTVKGRMRLAREKLAGVLA